MPVSGKLFIGARQVATAATFKAVDPRSGESLQAAFSAAGPAEIEQACELAWAASTARVVHLRHVLEECG